MGKKNKNFKLLEIIGLIIIGLIIIIVVTDINIFKFNECNKGRRIHFLDTFNNTCVMDGYVWFDEDEADARSLTRGHLEIEASRGQDLWGGGEKTGAPLLLREAPNCRTYEAETFVRADSITNPNQTLNTQMGLFVFEDEDNWFFFGLTDHDFIDGGSRVRQDGLIITVTGDGSSSIAAQRDLAQDGVFLKIKKALANEWECYWKLEQDDEWQLLESVNLRFGSHKVGMGVKTFDLFPNLYGPASAFFDYFLISK